MGGAQPLAVTMNDGVAICIDVDPRAIERRIEHRYLDVRADSLAHALQLAVEARDARRPLSIGLLGNAAELFPQMLAEGAPIDIVTDQTSAHDPLAYLPIGIAFEDMADAAAKDPAGFTTRARESMAKHVEAMVGFMDSRRRGLRLRQLDPRRGPTRRVRAGVRLPRLRPRLHPPPLLRGQGPLPLGRPVR